MQLVTIHSPLGASSRIELSSGGRNRNGRAGDHSAVLGARLIGTIARAERSCGGNFAAPLKRTTTPQKSAGHATLVAPLFRVWGVILRSAPKKELEAAQSRFTSVITWVWDARDHVIAIRYMDYGLGRLEVHAPVI
jgi:hypothetical protein